MDNNKIQDIITKSILEEASSDELLLLENWRNASSQNESLYQEYSAIWNASANYKTPDFQPKAESAYQKHMTLLANEEVKVVNLNPIQSVQTPITKSKSKFFTIRRMVSLAAIFVLALGAIFVFNTMNSTSISADNGVTFASLEDGTSIWLDEGSSLTYTNGFGKDHRNVDLKGKAFFDVKKNESLAFNIKSNDLEISVLGTSFTVDNKQGKNSVAVKSGRVSVQAEKQNVVLTADDKVIYENNNFTQVETSSEDVVWRNSKLSFNDAPIAQVIADINLFHNDKIKLNSDDATLDCPFTARTLANTSFENIIEILAITYDLKTENLENGDVLLTISECK